MSTKLTAKQKDKLIEAAQNAIIFEVEGRGEFPADMLRYDLCWPASSEDAHHMTTGNGLGWSAPYRITLKGLKEPTHARWASFGWRVVES